MVEGARDQADKKYASHLNRTTSASVGLDPVMVRAEMLSSFGDSRLGRIVPDSSAGHGRPRYCTNFASLRFVHRDGLKLGGYGVYLSQMEDIRWRRNVQFLLVGAFGGCRISSDATPA
jgi:hypothetical protein